MIFLVTSSSALFRFIVEHQNIHRQNTYSSYPLNPSTSPFAYLSAFHLPSHSYILLFSFTSFIFTFCLNTHLFTQFQCSIILPHRSTHLFSSSPHPYTLFQFHVNVNHHLTAIHFINFTLPSRIPLIINAHLPNGKRDTP